MIKQRLKSKTYWLGLTVTGLGLMQMNFPSIASFFGEYQGWVLIGIGIGIKAVRELTDKPLSAK